MDQYAILCDCTADPVICAFIDDDRAATGRFGFDTWPPQPEGVARQRKRGDRLPSRTVACPHCDRWVRLTHTTAAELIDRITTPVPGVGALRDLWGTTAIPFEDYADDAAAAARSVELEDMLTGVRDQSRPSDVPLITRYARMFVVPLGTLRELVSALDKRR